MSFMIKLPKKCDCMFGFDINQSITNGILFHGLLINVGNCVSLWNFTNETLWPSDNLDVDDLWTPSLSRRYPYKTI